MCNTKKISVIMGIYNCADTLSEAIDSLLAQTYNNWELIMCDDGSLDHTYEIAKNYADKFDNIFLIKNEKNMGLNYTLNHCLKYATGDYIARMDGDDISLPERFYEQVEFLDKNTRYAIVSSPMIYFDDDKEWGIGSGGVEPSAKDFVKASPIPHAPSMVKKEAYMSVDGYTVADKYIRVEDWHLWIKMYEAGYKAYVLEKPLYKMRDDLNALSRRKLKHRINEYRVSVFAINRLKLNKLYYLLALRPIFVGLLPRFIYLWLHKLKWGK